MALLKTLKPLISSAAIAVFVILAMTNMAYSHWDKTYFTCDFDVCQPKSLTYQGDAFFPCDFAECVLPRVLRLTKTESGSSQPGSVGRVLYSKPILFRAEGAVASFETTIDFNISSWNGGDKPADGLVFFVAPKGFTFPVGSQGGNLGVYNTSGLASNVLAVEFDVFVNQWDPKFPHIGINLGSRDSTNSTSFEGTIGELVSARINYEAASKLISVNATAGEANFEVSLVYDLSNLLPDQVQVGISAASGLDNPNAAVHDVISWHFISTLVRDQVKDAKISQI